MCSKILLLFFVSTKRMLYDIIVSSSREFRPKRAFVADWFAIEAANCGLRNIWWDSSQTGSSNTTISINLIQPNF